MNSSAKLKDASDLQMNCGSDAILEVRRSARLVPIIRPIREVVPGADHRSAIPGTPPAILQSAILAESDFDDLTILKRPYLLGDWFRAGDLGFIFGKRGLGKSWLSLAMARALAEGSSCGPWNAAGATRVLYVDGEMAADDLRSRNHSLRECKGDILFLSHQIVFDRTEKSLCLSDSTQQHELTTLCENLGVKVLILDNIGCLFRNVSENDADDWRDVVEGWLLGLRRRGIAVILVAHAGRNTQTMRGTSKREDAAFWILRLDEPTQADHSEGARFITRFTKNRNASFDPPPLEWEFAPQGEGVRVSYREADSLVILRQWIEDGLTSCTDIAAEMGLSKGQVSRLAKQAEKAGWLGKKGREYVLKPSLT